MNNECYDNFVNQDYKSLSRWLFSLSPTEFSLLASATGFLISPTLSINEQNSFGNFLILIGQILLTINAQSITKIQYSKTFSDLKPFIQKDNLTDEVAYIKEELYKIIKETYGVDNP